MNTGLVLVNAINVVVITLGVLNIFLARRLRARFAETEKLRREALADREAARDLLTQAYAARHKAIQERTAQRCMHCARRIKQEGSSS